VVVLNVYCYLIKVIFLSIFGKRKSYSIAVKSLFKSHSYRIPANINILKSPIVFYLKSIKLLFYKIEDAKYPLKQNDKAMYCSRPFHADFCINYSQMLGFEVDKINVIVRDTPNTSKLTVFDKLMVIIFNSFLCFFIYVLTPFIKESRKLSVLTLELTEATILMKNIKRNKTNYLYYFSAFEKDANWLALLLKRNNVFCHKIPSSNPIKNFYPTLISDKFSFTAPFQVYEYEKLKENWMVRELDIWPNLGSQNLLEYVIEKKGQPTKKTIGVFTRGMWLRKERGDSFLGVGEDVAEIEMLNLLNEFFNENGQLGEVYILLHPIEKSTPQIYDKAKLYYSQLFSGVELKFVDSNKPSFELFNLFDVGIASLSSVIFERLYCGYKCFLAPIDLKVKLFEDPSLENIIANNRAEFFTKFNEVLNISSEEYFSHYKLLDYRLSKIKSFHV